MPIYTKTGDDGTTALFSGKRVKKYDAQIETYGSVDELSSFIGVVISQFPPSPRLRRASASQSHKDLLTHIQKDLYSAMGILCGATTDLSGLEIRIKDFETTIDELDKKIPKLTRFILPQGTEVSALLHVVRTVCRRIERNVVHFFNTDTKINQSDKKIIVQYLNRLSDLLFMLARFYSEGKEVST